MDKSTQKMLARAGPILARLPRDQMLSFVEVGVNRGQLAEHLLIKRPLLTWHGVDPWWCARDHATRSYIATGDGHATQLLEVSERTHRETMQRVAPFGDRANVIRLPSPDAAGAFMAGTIDAIFLDADHSYDGVRADIAAWWPIVRRGGWLGGHDIRHGDARFDFTGVDRAVEEFVTQDGLELELDSGACWFVRKP